jgi:protein arginine N-methyltransferase 5
MINNNNTTIPKLSTTLRKPPSIGGEPFPCTSLQNILTICRDSNLAFAIVPLVHPRLERDSYDTLKRANPPLERPLTRSDYLLSSQQWSTLIVGKISTWIGLGIDNNNSNMKQRQHCEVALREEFALASHLSVPAVLCPSPIILPISAQQPLPFKIQGFENYARSLNHLLSKQSQTHAWLEINCHDWNTWNRFRILCDTPSNLHAAVVLSPIEEEINNTNSELNLQRWLGDQVRALIIPTRLFLKNSKGFPILNDLHKHWVVEMYKRNVQFVIRGRSYHTATATATGVIPPPDPSLLPYQMYLVHICRSSTSDMLDEQEEFESPYYDYLQIPLQPLGDNLESNTYEVFERDPVKYVRYQEAIRKAFQSCPKFHQENGQFIVMVVGAGRGPLVRCVLRAANELNLEKNRIFIYAVEKNPNAVITLLNIKREDQIWQNCVQVICSDMRTWKGFAQGHGQYADIIVSELLGSWGDNELSPECLAGVEKYLDPSHGVSIPWKYTSFLAPIQSHRIWSMTRDLSKGAFGTYSGNSNDDSFIRFETPYVVRLFNFYHIAEPQRVFEFEHHPIPSTTTTTAIATTGNNEQQQQDDDNDIHKFERYTTLNFIAKNDSIIHGFAGYFDSDLWSSRDKEDHVDISINPSTFSHGMFSWFALFLPLRVPIQVFTQETIQVSVWRMSSRNKVWYEWCVSVWGNDHGNGPRICSPIHNPSGRSSYVNL